MSTRLNDIVYQLVRSAPRGELEEVKNDLAIILPPDLRSMVNTAIEQFVLEKGIPLAEHHVAGDFNKDIGSSKYWDFHGRRKFNVDVKRGIAIDLEVGEPEVEYPSIYEQLVICLRDYGKDHYPTDFSLAVVPISSKAVQIVIIGLKLSKDNFYTGSWKSNYNIDDAGRVTGRITQDIHYYEDGNVRLELDEPIRGEIDNFSPSSIVNFINKQERDATLRVIEEFSTVNQKSFKSLRRLLPVTKSKINWGKAIGTYRLGSDVINQQ